MHPPILFSDRARLDAFFAGKSVAVVGSGPGVLDNDPGFVDSHDVVLRVNNHKCSNAAGWRTDVHFSFYGSSINVPRETLMSEGVKLCVCKCPDAKFMESEWHRERNKPHGVDWRYIFEARRDWWFCETFVPSVDEFRQGFDLLGGHVPTTGFAAILQVLAARPASVFVTGFDFFSSGLHNVDEKWRPGDPTDPIGHVPDLERQWLVDNLGAHPIRLDDRLSQIIKGSK